MWISLICLIIGGALGAVWREIYELRKHVSMLLDRAQPKAKPGATLGAYSPAGEYKQSGGIVSPKSPQLIEWEANQRTMQENLIQQSVKPK
jgi:hypothetical protein